jgi:hypothetical protein
VTHTESIEILLINRYSDGYGYIGGSLGLTISFIRENSFINPNKKAGLLCSIWLVGWAVGCSANWFKISGRSPDRMSAYSYNFHNY